MPIYRVTITKSCQVTYMVEESDELVAMNTGRERETDGDMDGFTSRIDNTDVAAVLETPLETSES